METWTVPNLWCFTRYRSCWVALSKTDRLPSSQPQKMSLKHNYNEINFTILVGNLKSSKWSSSETLNSLLLVLSNLAQIDNYYLKITFRRLERRKHLRCFRCWFLWGFAVPSSSSEASVPFDVCRSASPTRNDGWSRTTSWKPAIKVGFSSI